MLAYAIVGLLYSTHLIAGKNAGKEAYAATFILLIILGYCVYQGICKLQQWILSWPVAIKIIVPLIFVALIILCVVIIRKTNKNKLENTVAETTKTE